MVALGFGFVMEVIPIGLALEPEPDPVVMELTLDELILVESDAGNTTGMPGNVIGVVGGGNGGSTTFGGTTTPWVRSTLSA